MLKTFILGIVLGIAATAGILYAVPAVDQHREASIISVTPNGGNSESFHINIPMDRIMVGHAGQVLPAELDWPDDESLADVRVELYKLRNSKDTVIGVAARTAEDESGLIDWVLHLPARGSLYFNIDPVPREGGFRAGQMRTGTREFSGMVGAMTESWAADTSGTDGSPAGRIQLHASYSRTLESLK